MMERIAPVYETDRETVISTLNHLVESCFDGMEGYRQAAEAVESPTFKNLFIQYAAQRQQFATELANLVVGLDGHPAEGGSPVAALHRGWLNLRASFGGSDLSAILSECERGEDAAKAAYEIALESDLPENIYRVVHSHYELVTQAHNHIRDMRNAYRGDPGTGNL